MPLTSHPVSNSADDSIDPGSEPIGPTFVRIHIQCLCSSNSIVDVWLEKFGSEVGVVIATQQHAQALDDVLTGHAGHLRCAVSVMQIKPDFETRPADRQLEVKPKRLSCHFAELLVRPAVLVNDQTQGIPWAQLVFPPVATKSVQNVFRSRHSLSGLEDSNLDPGTPIEDREVLLFRTLALCRNNDESSIVEMRNLAIRGRREVSCMDVRSTREAFARRL